MKFIQRVDVNVPEKEKAFKKTWLKLCLSAEEYASIKKVPVALLKHLYSDIWERGPLADLAEQRFSKLSDLLTRAGNGTLPMEQTKEFITIHYDTYYLPRWNGNTTNAFTTRLSKEERPYLSSREVDPTRALMDSRIATAKQLAGLHDHYYPTFHIHRMVDYTVGKDILEKMALKSPTAKSILEVDDAFWAYVMSPEAG